MSYISHPTGRRGTAVLARIFGNPYKGVIDNSEIGVRQ